ncbi:MAG: PKD domain-containing protein [Candidatus Thermoplasmatota archaeon]|nr:PKD domain-containing protein [Candidatus Thermoplasmatota archaeon]
MAAGVILPSIPFDAEGASAPSEPLDPCFLAGTQITMADGSHKNIKQVEVGDMVKSFDNGSIVIGEVTEVYSHNPSEMPEYYMVINDKLRVTPNHIIYVNNEWIPARNITEGDELLGEHDETVIVTSVERVQEQAPTYNLEIQSYHTFFADGILVHNAKAPAEPIEPINNPPYTPSKPSGPTSVKTPPARFLSGTAIRMADGSHKNIKHIEQGDVVVSYNKGQVVNGEVIDVYEHTPEEMGDYYVVINDKIRVTPNHFLYVSGRWIPAKQVKIGDELIGENKEVVIVTSVEKVWEQVPTYNLEVDIYHTFFADGILVHNAKAGYTYSTSTTDPDGDNIYYLFDWGDGTDSGWRGPYSSGSTGYAYHLWNTPGTYQVKAKAKDEHGAVSSWSSSLTVVVNAAPVADFTYSPSSPTTQDTIQFTDQSTDEDGYIVSWSWNFGDGATSSIQNPTHQYPDDETYTVTLTVEDNDGATSSASKDVAVQNVAPTANFDYSPLDPTTESIIQFTDKSSDSDGDITAWQWNFGDGSTTSTQQNPSHVYTSAGSYSVTLTVTDNDGATASKTKTITVITEKEIDIGFIRSVTAQLAYYIFSYSRGRYFGTEGEQATSIYIQSNMTWIGLESAYRDPIDKDSLNVRPEVTNYYLNVTATNKTDPDDIHWVNRTLGSSFPFPPLVPGTHDSGWVGMSDEYQEGMIWLLEEN